MRAGYPLIVGLAAVKWPLPPDAHNQSLYEGVTLCLLVAMSLLVSRSPRLGDGCARSPQIMPGAAA